MEMLDLMDLCGVRPPCFRGGVCKGSEHYWTAIRQGPTRIVIRLDCDCDNLIVSL